MVLNDELRGDRRSEAQREGSCAIQFFIRERAYRVGRLSTLPTQELDRGGLMFRVQGSAEIPNVGVLVGANFQYLTGQPWAAYANVRLPQGSRQIFVEARGTRRLSSQTLLDLRISKSFRFGRDGRVEILADILNGANDTAAVGLVTNNFFSPNFGKGRRFVDPRRVMVGVKFSF
jgi:hypothetical protein